MKKQLEKELETPVHREQEVCLPWWVFVEKASEPSFVVEQVSQSTKRQSSGLEEERGLYYRRQERSQPPVSVLE